MMLPPKPQNCPKCVEQQLRTIESRSSPTSTRRRKKCGACGYRVTTHEVSVEFYNQAKENQILVDKFRKLLGASEPVIEQEELKCPSCKYNVNGDYCSFDLPEYNTSDSYDCNHYKLQPS